MHETIVTVVGNVIAEPELRHTSRGDVFTTFRLACTERRRDQSGAWGDGHTNWVRVTAFRTLAQNSVGTLTKGMRVIVQGRLRVSEWQNDERRGTNVEIDAHAIGPELTFAHAEVTRGIWTGATDPLADTKVREASEGVPEQAGYGGPLVRADEGRASGPDAVEGPEDEGGYPAYDGDGEEDELGEMGEVLEREPALV